jgi:UDP-N-acetylenolpyruvoylglucosamine reductase
MYDKHAMCVVNYENGSYKDLENFINEIKEKVRKEFYLEIEEEPVFIKQ